MSPHRKPDDVATTDGSPHVSRRLFLKSSLAATAGAGIAAPAAVAQDATPSASPAAEMAGMEQPAVEFFNRTEALMVEALTARILPGTPDDPGAREAGVLYYIDNALHGSNEGYTVKTYTQGPYLIVSEEQAQVETTSRTDSYQVVPVTQDLVSRYGYQSVLTPQDIYRRGLKYVNAWAQKQFQADFVDLSEDQQDSVLQDMQDNKADTFDAPTGSAFFTVLRNHTIEGMFSDPLYGGNRGMVGWKLIGFPGARGYYTADEIGNASFTAEPMSLAEMDMSKGHGG
jgi:hypothetical protein